MLWSTKALHVSDRIVRYIRRRMSLTMGMVRGLLAADVLDAVIVSDW